VDAKVRAGLKAGAANKFALPRSHHKRDGRDLWTAEQAADNVKGVALDPGHFRGERRACEQDIHGRETSSKVETAEEAGIEEGRFARLRSSGT
jgi:hypothetical protein